MLKPRTAYVEELAAWVQDQPPKRRGQDTNAVAFLAVREDVEAAIAAGFPLTTIWRHLHETRRLGFRYDTFLKYVRKHVRRDAPAAPAQSVAASPPCPAPVSSPVPPPEPRRTGTTVPGFRFTAATDPKELF
ncbi:TraK family protein [uncultured Azohydromonas sp.]|uniref:TraK family protein n=1 Tax=uncultured Azohydromonas sp. TaxID=487342 RepID=UPI00260BDBBF|nr:TraK family protein [uncultured Azohydromonas sp.]